MTLRKRRFLVLAVLGLLTFDLIDGPTPLAAADGPAQTSAGPSLSAPAFDAHDAEYFCARATVSGPVLVVTGPAPSSPVRSAQPFRLSQGFQTQPFHPPRPSL